MPNLDRFAQGLKDPQAADFWTCPKCGKEVYDLEAERCPHCVDNDMEGAMEELIKLSIKYNVDFEGKIIHESGVEECL